MKSVDQTGNPTVLTISNGRFIVVVVVVVVVHIVLYLYTRDRVMVSQRY